MSSSGAIFCKPKLTRQPTHAQRGTTLVRNILQAGRCTRSAEAPEVPKERVNDTSRSNSNDKASRSLPSRSPAHPCTMLAKIGQVSCHVQRTALPCQMPAATATGLRTYSHRKSLRCIRAAPYFCSFSAKKLQHSMAPGSGEPSSMRGLLRAFRQKMLEKKPVRVV